jgi:uncharacterized membrane protein YccC
MPDLRDTQDLVQALERVAYALEHANQKAARAVEALEAIAEQYGITLPLLNPEPPDCGDLFSIN